MTTAKWPNYESGIYFIQPNLHSLQDEPQPVATGTMYSPPPRQQIVNFQLSALPHGVNPEISYIRTTPTGNLINVSTPPCDAVFVTFKAKAPDISAAIKEYDRGLRKYAGTELAWTINGIYQNNRAVGRYLSDVRNKKPTGNIQYQQTLIQEMLAKLPRNGSLGNFVKREFAIHRQHSKTAKRVIGNKLRDFRGLYKLKF